MHTGYVGVTTIQMLDHLNENYGIITVVDIEDNDTRMREPYNPTFPIETLLHQIELAVEYATIGKRPYQEAQVAYLLALQTGLYAETCRDCDKQALADKKMVPLQDVCHCYASRSTFDANCIETSRFRLRTGNEHASR